METVPVIKENQEKVKFSDLVHFTPKQMEATKMADEFGYFLYGGAAGGGKSYWLRWYPIRWMIRMYQEHNIEGLRFGLFCEDYVALKDRHITKMQYEFPQWLGELKDSKTEGLGFKLNKDFGSGVLALRNLDDPSKYFSSEFAGIAIDELTKNPKETFDFLRMRKRHPGIDRTKFIAGTNPGDIGHEWVKKMWITGEFDENEKEADQFAFLPARVEDNPHLPESYIVAMESLPEKLRTAYREGNWDVFEGQYFSEWDARVHIVEPFKIPVTWKRFRSIDVSGFHGITACSWFAVDYDGTVWVYKEYYGTERDNKEHAEKITEMSEGEEYDYTVIDSSAFDKMGMPETTAEVYMKHGVTNLVPSSKKRIMGWDFFHQYLNHKEHPPRMKFFSTCVNCIRTIPLLIHDDHHPEDVNTKGEDHLADEIRYFLQTLRDTKSPEPENAVQRRLREIKESTLHLGDFTF